jgi:(p)ppGpp synthase/HD superfamily hydrolase
MSVLEKAISIALEAHKGQVDKAGNAYILHPLRIMFQMETEDEMIVAILHDVVEDTEITFDYLRDQGFSKRVLESLESLTRRAEESYSDYINRAGKDPIGIKIKQADLIDNMNLSRMKRITEKDLGRMRRYSEAFALLKGHKRT